MTVLGGTRVRLRAFHAEEFELLWKAVWGADPTVAVGNPDADGLRARMASSGQMTDRELLMAVDVEGTLRGSIQAYRDGVPPGVFELGIDLFQAADRNKGYGTEAVRLLTAHLFDAEGARRIEAGTAFDNAPMRAVLARLGFQQEGVRRRFYPSEDGAGVDCVVYGMTKDDFEDVRNRWT